MKHRLTRRLLLYFSAALLAFSLVIGGVFGFLFRRYTLELHTNDLKTHAEVIAASLSGDHDLPSDNPGITAETATNPPSLADYPMHGHRRGMMRRQNAGTAPPSAQSEQSAAAMGPHTYCRRQIAAEPATSSANPSGDTDAALSALLRQLNAFTGSDVWLVDRAARTITLSGANTETDYTELPPAAENLLETVFMGENVAGETFSALTNAPSVTVGAPIRDADGNVSGAVLMHRRLSDIHASEKAGFQILAVSLALAFLLAAGLACLLARRFIRPLAAMEEMAAALAEGDYETRSGVRQDDEIGSLARSLDALAERLKAAAEQSAKLDAMRRDFFASISHELRTPLTVLRGSLDALSAGLVEDEQKKRDYLAQMQSNAAHLERLVNDIFDLARLENPDFSIEKTDVDLSDALRDAMRAARRLAAQKQISILCEDAPSIPIQGDYGRLRQMFLAVLDNAVKFSPENASVEIAVESSETRWTVTIKDNGPGISVEVLPHIFDRFRTSRNEGTGLGLAIAQNIARRHDVVLEAKNGETGGAVFSFRGHSIRPNESV